MRQAPDTIDAEAALRDALGRVLARFGTHVSHPGELHELAELEAHVTRMDAAAFQHGLQRLSHAGYLHDALATACSALLNNLDPILILLVARELTDALAPDLGVELAQRTLDLPEIRARPGAPDTSFGIAHALLADTKENHGDPEGALGHFEAVLAVDISDVRALAGWERCSHRMALRRGSVATSRAVSPVDGIEILELDGGGIDGRYELLRPLGRGRHAVVFEARDRKIGRDVALKRLLPAQDLGMSTARLIDAAFFAEARALARVRSAFVVALLDSRPERKFIALQLCRGGNLRSAVRRHHVGPKDVPRIGEQLRCALDAVHAAGTVHRDVKPANILLRTMAPESPIALADFGIAHAHGGLHERIHAGTLRYLAPELRSGSAPDPATDRFSAGVVLLEVALHGLPDVFDHLDFRGGASHLVPTNIEPRWRETMMRLLSERPEDRTFDV